MTSEETTAIQVDLEELRSAVKEEYAVVAEAADRAFQAKNAPDPLLKDRWTASVPY